MTQVVPSAETLPRNKQRDRQTPTHLLPPHTHMHTYTHTIHTSIPFKVLKTEIIFLHLHKGKKTQKSSQ